MFGIDVVKMLQNRSKRQEAQIESLESQIQILDQIIRLQAEYIRDLETREYVRIRDQTIRQNSKCG